MDTGSRLPTSDGSFDLFSFLQVAVKKVKDSYTMLGSALDDMEREAKIMKQLNHSNIIKLLGVMHDGSTTIIVTEYIGEGSLDRYLHVNRHSVDFKQLFGYSQNILEGMDYLTRSKIIHRDLAARNILVVDKTTVKISDFGLSRVGDCNDCFVMHSANSLPPVKWAAIECLTHREYSHKSDIWSFGVTLWEMFSLGRNPTLAGCEDFFTCYERISQDCEDWLVRLAEGLRLPRTPCCPEFLYSRVMLRCWEREPAARPSVRQLKEEMKQVALEVARARAKGALWACVLNG
jgi:serine/threonine protein kinase